MPNKHTPGPWRRSPGQFDLIRAADGRSVCRLVGDTASNPFADGEALANAKLIEAAPDLAAMLAKLLIVVRQWRGDSISTPQALACRELERQSEALLGTLR